MEAADAEGRRKENNEEQVECEGLHRCVFINTDSVRDKAPGQKSTDIPTKNEACARGNKKNTTYKKPELAIRQMRQEVGRKMGPV